jgi:hypothetical protein
MMFVCEKVEKFIKKSESIAVMNLLSSRCSANESPRFGLF